MFKSHMLESCVVENQPTVAHRILLVDDDPVFRSMTKCFLQKSGYQVLEAENGFDGLCQLRENLPDLVMCDLSMPVLNGLEFAEEVSLEYPSLPLIVVSATEDIADVARVLRFGINDFLSKPITNHGDLNNSIKNILTNNHDTQSRDFLNRWYRVDRDDDLSEEQELHGNLQYLQQNAPIAKELLEALLPQKESQFGTWQSSYRLLQSAERMPLVFDYDWRMNGQFVFYLVDAASDEQSGAVSTLLVRALFNDYLRNLRDFSIELKDLAENIERGIRCMAEGSMVSALFGVVNLVSGTLSLLPAGIDCQWSNQNTRNDIASGVQLGNNSLRNFITKELPIHSACQIILSKPSAYRFTLDLSRGCEV